MADQTFVDFPFKSPSKEDFLVGYNANSSNEFKTTVSTLLSSYALSSISVTYSQLTALSSSRTFVTGQFYTLTDFVTEYMSNDNEWISPQNTTFITNNSGVPIAVSAIAATPEPLILQAVASNKLSHIAYSLSYPSDIIHYEPSYTYLDGTHTAKGFITYRRDPIREIECFYDWRNVRFKRWNLNLSAIATTGGITSTPILSVQPSTQYKPGDVAYINTSVLVCLSAHTTPSSVLLNGSSQIIGAENAWMRYFNTTNLMHDLALKRPGFGNSTSFAYDGGFGQANYYPTFSTSSAQLNTTAVFQVKINKIALTSEASLSPVKYSLTFNNIVCYKQQTNAAFRQLTFDNCRKMTFLGLGTRSHNYFDNNYELYVSNGNFLDNKVTDTSYSYFFGDIRTSVLENIDFSVIYCGVNGSVNTYGNIAGCIMNDVGTSTIKDCGYVYFAPGAGYEVGSVGGGPTRLMYLNPTNWIGSGKTKVTIGSSYIPHYEYYDETENFVRKSYYDKPLLYAHTDNAIVSRLSAVSTANFKDIYSTQNHSLSTYVRNLSCWCYDLAQEMTCISPWNSSASFPGGATGAGVLVTPRHVLMAAHFPLSAGNIMRFVTQDNQNVHRTIVETLTHPMYNINIQQLPQWPDVTIGLLDSDVPNTITPCSILSSNFVDYLSNKSSFYFGVPSTGVLYTDQEEKALVADFHNTNKVYCTYQTPTNTIKLSAYESLIGGDSGNPIFLIVNNKLALLGVWTGIVGSSSYSTDLGNIQTQTNNLSTYISLQDMVSAVDLKYGIATNYQLTAVNLSDFAKFTTV